MIIIIFPPESTDFSELFALLGNVKGQPTFPTIVERLISEANRFKRKNLAEQLMRQLPQISALHSNNSNNGCSLWRMAAAQNAVKR